MRVFINKFGMFVFSISLFLLTLGMFLYQKNSSINLIKENQTEILVATKDINGRTNINEENVGWKMVDKSLISENNITRESKLEKEKVKSTILEGEFINIKKLEKSSGSENEVDNYYIDIVPDFSSNLLKGDLIKVYVQIVDKNGDINNRLVFTEKEVLEVINNEETYGNQQKTIKLEATDIESLKYYNAKQKGNIIVLKYLENVNNPDIKIPFININETSILNSEENLSLTDFVKDMEETENVER